MRSLVASPEWVIAWDGQVWTESDVLAADLATVQALVEDGWSSCDPWRGPMELMAMIATLVARRAERDVREVLAEVGLASAEKLQTAIARRG